MLIFKDYILLTHASKSEQNAPPMEGLIARCAQNFIHMLIFLRKAK